MFVFFQKQPKAIGLCWQMDCNVLSGCLALPGKWLLCFASGVLFRCQVFQKSDFPSCHKGIAIVLSSLLLSSFSERHLLQKWVVLRGSWHTSSFYWSNSSSSEAPDSF